MCFPHPPLALRKYSRHREQGREEDEERLSYECMNWQQEIGALFEQFVESPGKINTKSDPSTQGSKNSAL